MTDYREELEYWKEQYELVQGQCPEEGHEGYIDYMEHLRDIYQKIQAYEMAIFEEGGLTE